MRTAWTKVRDKAKDVGRWHDNRHTLVTGTAECEPGDQTIRDIAGQVSRQMLARYSHIRMEARRKAPKGIVSKPASAPQLTEEEKPTKVRPVQ